MTLAGQLEFFPDDPVDVGGAEAIAGTAGAAQVAAVDWESGKFVAARHDGAEGIFFPGRCLDGQLQAFVGRGGVLVVEAPHLAPDLGQSKAQPFTRDQLVSFCALNRAAGITVYTAPHRTARKRSRGAGNGAVKDGYWQPDKARDYLSLLWAAQQGHTWRLWTAERALAYVDPAVAEWRADQSRRMNLFRNDREEAPRFTGPDFERLTAAVQWVVGRCEPGDPHVSYFRFATDKEAVQKPHVQAIWTGLATEDGDLRRWPSGTRLGIHSLFDEVIQLHEHGRGFARSQIVYHVWRHQERARFEKRHPIDDTPSEARLRSQFRDELRVHLKWLARGFRDYLLRDSIVGAVPIAILDGAEPIAEESRELLQVAA